MTEEQKKRVAVFRFGDIHDLINGNDADQGPQEALISDSDIVTASF